MDFVAHARKLGLNGIKKRMYFLTAGIFVGGYLLQYAPDSIRDPLTAIVAVPLMGGILYYVFLYQLYKTTN